MGKLLTEVVSFYREFQVCFIILWLISLNNKENISKSLFSFDIENMVEIQERVDTHFLLFLNQNPSVHPKQFPFGEICGAFILTILWSGISIRYNIRI